MHTVPNLQCLSRDLHIADVVPGWMSPTQCGGLATGLESGVLSTGPGQTDGAAGLRYEVTGLVLSTVLVSTALHTDTGHQGVALQALATHTLGLVEFHQALSSPATGAVRVETRVETVLVDTGFVEGTVSVGPTLRSVALTVRVPSVALRTGADRVVARVVH